MDGAVVVTVTVKTEGEDPFGVSEVGATVQVANEGAPVQDSAIVPVKPFSAEACKLYVAVFPAFTVAVVEPPVAAAREKSVALPVRATVCGLPLALSVMVSEPVRLPLVEGANVTLKVQLAAGATVLPQVLD